jgi:hypothetical protein
MGGTECVLAVPEDSPGRRLAVFTDETVEVGERA